MRSTRPHGENSHHGYSSGYVSCARGNERGWSRRELGTALRGIHSSSWCMLPNRPSRYMGRVGTQKGRAPDKAVRGGAGSKLYQLPAAQRVEGPSQVRLAKSLCSLWVYCAPSISFNIHSMELWSHSSHQSCHLSLFSSGEQMVPSMWTSVVHPLGRMIQEYKVTLYGVQHQSYTTFNGGSMTRLAG